MKFNINWNMLGLKCLLFEISIYVVVYVNSTSYWMSVNQQNNNLGTGCISGQPQRAINKYLSISTYPCLTKLHLTLDYIFAMYVVFYLQSCYCIFQIFIIFVRIKVVCLQSLPLTGRESIYTIAGNITS